MSTKHKTISTNSGRWATKIRCIKRLLSSKEFILVYPKKDIDRAIVIDGMGNKDGLMGSVVKSLQNLPVMKPDHMRSENINRNKN